MIAGTVAVAGWALRRAAPGGARTWERTNHAGRHREPRRGTGMALGAVVGVLASPGVERSVRVGATVATVGSAVFGAIDDLAGSSDDKGLRGHLGAMARGRLTTGGLKVLGIGATALAGAWPMLAGSGAGAGRRARPASGRLARTTDALVAGALVAGAANLGNLLDLRPGRVLKIVLLVAPLLPSGDGGAATVSQGRRLGAAAAGAAAALLPADLGEHGMLGDCGANAAGALLGSALVAGTSACPPGRATRAGALCLVVALTLASERVSFTRVIEATPGLRELDAAGRRARPAPG